jgi:hypothetical protein
MENKTMITEIQSSLQLLELLLDGYLMTADDIDLLIARPRVFREDLNIEYKHGNELEKPNKDATNTIREYMSAFANSAGGILILGIDAPSGEPKGITGCNRNDDLAEWASRCLTPIAGYFSPIPRFQVVSHSNGKILIGVVPRSLGMVPCIKDGKLVYYLRLHDQTLEAPEYLMADILLGRRQRASFDISNWQVLNFQVSPIDEMLLMNLRFDLKIKLENSNIVWAENSRWGIISRVRMIESGTFSEVDVPSQSLLSFIDLHNIINDQDVKRTQLMHVRGNAPVDKPFDAGNISFSFLIPFRSGGEFLAYSWRAALYITSKDNLPSWYQIDFIVNKDVERLIHEKSTLTKGDQQFSITKVGATLPVVAWDGL